MLTIDFCYKCKIDLSRLSPALNSGNFSDFQDICTHFLETGHPVEMAIDEETGLTFLSNKDLSELERNGFIISTECSKDFIKIIPLGISCELTPLGLVNCRVCCNRENHD